METTTARNATLADIATLLQDQQGRKLDVVVPARQIRAENGNLILPGIGEPQITLDGVTTTDGTFTPTQVCDGGIAAKLDIPVGYLRRTRTTATDLYDRNVNHWLQASDPGTKYLIRNFTGGDGGTGVARAFLSNSYRPIDNLDALMAVLEGIKNAGVPVEISNCDLTERRMYVAVRSEAVAALAPALLAGYRSPFTGNTGADNPTVFAGFVISNSEVGAGAFSITPRLVAQVCSNGMTITRDAMRQQHLGTKLDDGVFQWSADTQVKNLALITAQARDAVKAFLSEEYLNTALRGLEAQAGKPVTNAEETVKVVAQRLHFGEERRALILDHFIRGGDLTAGGVMHAVTSAAQTLGDADDAYELEATGVRAMELAASL